MEEAKLKHPLQVFPLAAAFVGYVVLWNQSLQLNSVGFYQLAKIAITPALIAIEAAFYAKRPTRMELAAVAVLCMGVTLATVTDDQVRLLCNLNIGGLFIYLGTFMPVTGRHTSHPLALQTAALPATLSLTTSASAVRCTATAGGVRHSLPTVHGGGHDRQFCPCTANSLSKPSLVDIVCLTRRISGMHSNHILDTMSMMWPCAQ